MKQSRLDGCGCSPGRKHGTPLTMEVQGRREAGRERPRIAFGLLSVTKDDIMHLGKRFGRGWQVNLDGIDCAVLVRHLCRNAFYMVDDAE